jgi:carotenoid 1,2-hydratase
VDAVSDDGRHALSIIGLLGSVFSPFYAKARRAAGPVDPLGHCSMNVALYGPGSSAWVLTERGAGAVTRGREELAIGPSHMRWEGSSFVIDFDERSAPLGTRVAGTVRIHPEELGGETVHLDAAGRHRWTPIAPLARAEVELRHPSLRWKGAAYLDSNGGDRPLEQDFSRWDWSRVASKKGARVTYDVDRRDGSRLLFARAFEHGGRAHDLPAVARVPGERTLWGLDRKLHASPGERPALLETLEDTPFYARSLVRVDRQGPSAIGTQETLCLDRFQRPWVQFLLPYRMRREP